MLNAEDEIVADLADLSDGEVIYFAGDPDAPVMAAHLAAGGRGVFVRGGRITLASGSDEVRLCRLGDVPAIGKRKDAATIANVLAGVAAGWALGLSHDVIITGVKTFGLELPDPAALLAQMARRSPTSATRN